MKDIKGFLKIKRAYSTYRPVCERVGDYKDVVAMRSEDKSIEQATRCMDCGTPFCHWACPVDNYIPEWNDMVLNGQWERAFQLLSASNNLPEITGRLCPALCEFSCVLGINDDPVTVRENELAIIEYAFKNGIIKPNPPMHRTGKKVAVIGSGPAGLSCADQLNKAGHNVIVFERDKKIGGILRYGIPDFKLEKWVLGRRIDLLKQEGIEFVTSVNVDADFINSKLKKEFNAVCLAIGSRTPRDLNIEGRNLNGIYFAMDYLIQSNKRIDGEIIPAAELIDAKDKRVVVIGGGDTGSDCVGTAHRQGAKCVIQIELLPRPCASRTEDFPWPKYPLILKTSSSHQEGGERQWAISTKKFLGENGSVQKLLCSKVDFSCKDEKGCSVMKETAGSEFEIDANMVVLCMGFTGPQKKGLLEDLNLQFDKRGNVQTNQNYMTSIDGIFSAGDMHRGQSLVVWAIQEGRKAASSITDWLLSLS